MLQAPCRADAVRMAGHAPEPPAPGTWCPSAHRPVGTATHIHVLVTDVKCGQSEGERAPTPWLQGRPEEVYQCPVAAVTSTTNWGLRGDLKQQKWVLPPFWKPESETKAPAGSVPSGSCEGEPTPGLWPLVAASCPWLVARSLQTASIFRGPPPRCLCVSSPL